MTSSRMMMMSLTIRLPIIPLLLGAIVFALLISLGLWQLDRAEQKRVFQRAFAAVQEAPYLAVQDAESLSEMDRFTRVVLEGQYEPGRQGLLDAQIHRGQAGYRVWTPFRLENGDAVLVDRGWVPADGDRTQLPDITIADERRMVRGMVAPFPEPGLRLGPADLGREAWPRRLHWPDAAAARSVWGEDLATVIVLLGPTEPDGFVREWDPVGPVPPERHIGYAVQWFGLAFALLVIAVVVNVRREEKQDD